MAVLVGVRYFGSYFYGSRFYTPVYFGTPPSAATFVPRQVRRFGSGVVVDVVRVAPKVTDLATAARVYGGPSQQASWAREANFWYDGLTPFCRRPPSADSLVFNNKQSVPTSVGPTGKPATPSS